MAEEVKKRRFSLVRYLKETRQELNRVTWPTARGLFKNTCIVLAVVILFALLVWVLDTVLSSLLALVLK